MRRYGLPSRDDPSESDRTEDDTGAATHATAARATVVRALAPERYKLQVTINAESRAKLRRAQDLVESR